MSTEPAAVERAVIRYKSTLKLAHETARGGAGREAAKLHGQAMAMSEIAMTLLGAEAWHQACDKTRAS